MAGYNIHNRPAAYPTAPSYQSPTAPATHSWPLISWLVHHLSYYSPRQRHLQRERHARDHLGRSGAYPRPVVRHLPCHYMNLATSLDYICDHGITAMIISWFWLRKFLSDSYAWRAGDYQGTQSLATVFIWLFITLIYICCAVYDGLNWVTKMWYWYTAKSTSLYDRQWYYHLSEDGQQVFVDFNMHDLHLTLDSFMRGNKLLPSMC
jgi:hypothetical protein